MTLLAQLASDDALDAAYQGLCRRRRDYSANSDVWSFRQCWQREKERIKAELLSANYRFALLSRITASICRSHPVAPTSRATAVPSAPCARSAIISPKIASCCGRTPHLKIESHFNEIPFRRERQSLGTIIKCESEPMLRAILQIC
jgi:hypothetical protein